MDTLAKMFKFCAHLAQITELREHKIYYVPLQKTLMTNWSEFHQLREDLGLI